MKPVLSYCTARMFSMCPCRHVAPMVAERTLYPESKALPRPVVADILRVEKRLVSMHGVGEAILDQLLREVRFVDLYRIVQQSLIASEPGYSIKDLEVFYFGKRTEEVTAASDSIVIYERWRETQDPALLESIRAYNEVDCRSTKGLRDWLVAAVRPADLAWPNRKDFADKKETPKARASREEIEREHLRQQFAGLSGVLAGPPAELLFELMWFHEREDKPRWWAMFDRASRESDELIDDLDSLGGLVASGPARPEKRSPWLGHIATRSRKPSCGKGIKVKARGELGGDELPTVEILRLDPEALEVDVKFGSKAGAPPDRLDLIPGGPYDNDVLRDAVRRVAQSVLDGGGQYPAIEALLARQHPRVRGHAAGAPLIPESADIVGATVDVVRRTVRSVGSCWCSFRRIPAINANASPSFRQRLSIPGSRARPARPGG